MSDNPYQSPKSDAQPQPQPVGDRVVGIRSGSPQDLRIVVHCHRGIQLCMLLYLLCLPMVDSADFLFSHYSAWQTPLVLAISVVALAIEIATVALVYVISSKVYSTTTSILWGIIAAVPCIGLMVLLHFDGKAQSVLKLNGVRVGLLGARISDIDAKWG